MDFTVGKLLVQLKKYHSFSPLRLFCCFRSAGYWERGWDVVSETGSVDQSLNFIEEDSRETLRPGQLEIMVVPLLAFSGCGKVVAKKPRAWGHTGGHPFSSQVDQANLGSIASPSGSLKGAQHYSDLRLPFTEMLSLCLPPLGRTSGLICHHCVQNTH